MVHKKHEIIRFFLYSNQRKTGGIFCHVRTIYLIATVLLKEGESIMEDLWEGHFF